MTSMTKRMRRAAYLCAAVPALAGAQAPADRTDRITAGLQRMLDAEVAAHPSLPGEIVHVLAPGRGLDVSLAAGTWARGSGRPLRPHDGFRVASVTKTFVAASILRLAEEGRIRLDDPIGRHLPAATVAALRADGYRVDDITVRHLLTHTSGIHDYATDERYYAAVLGDPAHRWTRAEQVDSALAYGDPHFAPGAGYHYSDTGYVLLGEMVERLRGQPLAQALRTLLRLDRVPLDETYLETLEPAPGGAGAPSHAYFGELDTSGWDPSFDLYGGGGLVSSAQDLAHFYRALLTGGVFRDPATLATMLTVPATNERAAGGAYAMGMQRRRIGGQACWGHTGFWGTSAFHCPDADVTIVRHYNQAQPEDAFTFADLFDRIAGLLEMAPANPSP
jgi:D-alanyl-D-alanine carboxypeptidase